MLKDDGPYFQTHDLAWSALLPMKNNVTFGCKLTVGTDRKLGPNIWWWCNHFWIAYLLFVVIHCAKKTCYGECYAAELPWRVTFGGRDQRERAWIPQLQAQRRSSNVDWVLTSNLQLCWFVHVSEHYQSFDKVSRYRIPLQWNWIIHVWHQYNMALRWMLRSLRDQLVTWTKFLSSCDI